MRGAPGCRSCCLECADPAAAEYAALARALRPAGVVDTIGKIGVWPSEVEQEKARIGGVAESVNVTIARCYDRSSPKRLAWDALYLTWKQFQAQPVGVFGAGGDFDVAQQYERQIAGFAAQAQADGCAGAPSVTPRGDRDDESTAAITSAVKFGAVAVVAIAAAVLVTKVL